jgi:citrate lyase subunit beta / citryl-CoA lyase
MKAKLAIHPTQVDIINTAFTPSSSEVDYYSRMVAEFERAQQQEGKAAITFESKMVDIAAYRRAKALLLRAQFHKL